MKVLGFNFTKISADKKEKSIKVTNATTNIEFMDLAKETVDFLKKDEVVRVKFKFEVMYEPKVAEITFEGSILLGSNEEEINELVKHWKGKKIPDEIKMNLLNLIIARCSVRALSLEEELNLPFHIKLPKIAALKEKD